MTGFTIAGSGARATSEAFFPAALIYLRGRRVDGPAERLQRRLLTVKDGEGLMRSDVRRALSGGAVWVGGDVAEKIDLLFIPLTAQIGKSHNSVHRGD